MGYGSRALELVLEYYEGRISDLSESEVEMETVRTVDLSQVSKSTPALFVLHRHLIHFHFI